MNRFRHLIDVGSFFQRILAVRIYAVRALDGVGHCKRNQGLFACSEGTFGENGSVVIKEFLCELRRSAGDFAEAAEVGIVEIVNAMRHAGSGGKGTWDGVKGRSWRCNRKIPRDRSSASFGLSDP